MDIADEAVAKWLTSKATYSEGDCLEDGAYYVMRNGLPVGPIERWNPILRVAKLVAPVTTEHGTVLDHLTWDVCGGSTYRPEFDIVARLCLAKV